MARSFSSNPSIGDVTYQTMYVGVNFAAGRTAAVIVALLGSGIGITVATTIASAVAQDVANVKGVYITIKYTYGYTNDGLIDWNMGPAVDYGTY